MISVPVVADGAIRGYVVAQFAFTASAKLMKHMPIKPDLYVLDEAFQLIDLYGRRGRFTFATNVRITVNGQTTDLSHLPAGAHALARALRLTPTEISVLDRTVFAERPSGFV